MTPTIPKAEVKAPKKRRKAKADRIYWTDQEKEHLIAEVKKRHAENPTTPILSLLKQAQMVLPKERQRPLLSVPAYVNRAIKSRKAQRPFSRSGASGARPSHDSTSGFLDPIIDRIADLVVQRVLARFNHALLE